MRRREDDGLRAQQSEIAAAECLRQDLLHLVRLAVIARELAAVNDVWILRVRYHVSVLLRRHRMPLTESDNAIIAAAADARRAALLLPAAQPIRKCIVSVHVIHLRGGLVVPAAP